MHIGVDGAESENISTWPASRRSSIGTRFSRSCGSSSCRVPSWRRLKRRGGWKSRKKLTFRQQQEARLELLADRVPQLSWGCQFFLTRFQSRGRERDLTVISAGEMLGVRRSNTGLVTSCTPVEAQPSNCTPCFVAESPTLSQWQKIWLQSLGKSELETLELVDCQCMRLRQRQHL